MKKIGLVVIALILALGSMGLGYAKWNDSVAFTKTVNTGKVCVNAVVGSNNDPCDSPSKDKLLNVFTYPITTPYTNYTPYIFTSPKDVACIAVTPDPNDPNSLVVTVTNAYPGYFGDLEVEVCNCGTVPVKLESIVVTQHSFPLASQPWFGPEQTCDGPIFVDTTDGIGTQLDVNGSTQCTAASWKFIVQECAEQGATYTFTITWTLSQWNEFGINPD